MSSGAVDDGILQNLASQFSTLTTMSSVRIARAALRARSVAVARPIQRRGYADAVSDKIKLSLALPHQVRARAILSRGNLDADFGANEWVSSQSTSRKMCTRRIINLGRRSTG